MSSTVEGIKDIVLYLEQPYYLCLAFNFIFVCLLQAIHGSINGILRWDYIYTVMSFSRIQCEDSLFLLFCILLICFVLFCMPLFSSPFSFFPLSTLSFSPDFPFSFPIFSSLMSCLHFSNVSFPFFASPFTFLFVFSPLLFPPFLSSPLLSSPLLSLLSPFFQALYEIKKVA